jgi:hypothetical protein
MTTMLRFRDEPSRPVPLAMTNRRHDPDATRELPDEFWGERTEWTPQPRRSVERTGLGATVGRWWDVMLGGSALGERSHRSGPGDRGRSSEFPAESSIEHGVATHDDFSSDDAWTVEPQPTPSRSPGIDPLIARLGGVAVILTLAAPLVVGFTASGSDGNGAESLASVDTSVETQAPTAPLPDPASAPSATVPTTNESTAMAPTTDLTATAPTSAASGANGADVADNSTTVVDDTSAALTAAPTEADAAAAQSVDPCGDTYELAFGDYWIRIADAADVSLADLLAVNDATVDTVLVPGRSICLPVGSTTPAPPTSVATTTPRVTTTAATNPPTTTQPSRPTTTPTTTAPAPTTTAPVRPVAVPASEAVAIIRSVWPDDLEERALEIAWRESNHTSNVNNYCCYGLFQIHWEAHRSWLGTVGITSVSQLYDPVLNTTAAYTLYQRAGGFGPWGG